MTSLHPFHFVERPLPPCHIKRDPSNDFSLFVPGQKPITISTDDIYRQVMEQKKLQEAMVSGTERFGSCTLLEQREFGWFVATCFLDKDPAISLLAKRAFFEMAPHIMRANSDFYEAFHQVLVTNQAQIQKEVSELLMNKSAIVQSAQERLGHLMAFCLAIGPSRKMAHVLAPLLEMSEVSRIQSAILAVAHLEACAQKIVFGQVMSLMEDPTQCAQASMGAAFAVLTSHSDQSFIGRTMFRQLAPDFLHLALVKGTFNIFASKFNESQTEAAIDPIIPGTVIPRLSLVWRNTKKRAPTPPASPSSSPDRSPPSSSQGLSRSRSPSSSSS